jgi:hypothetical protein
LQVHNSKVCVMSGLRSVIFLQPIPLRKVQFQAQFHFMLFSDIEYVLLFKPGETVNDE